MIMLTIAETRKSGRGCRRNCGRMSIDHIARERSSALEECNANQITFRSSADFKFCVVPIAFPATSRLARKTVSEAQAQAKLQLAHRAGRSNHTKGGRGRSRRN